MAMQRLLESLPRHNLNELGRSRTLGEPVKEPRETGGSSRNGLEIPHARTFDCRKSCGEAANSAIPLQSQKTKCHKPRYEACGGAVVALMPTAASAGHSDETPQRPSAKRCSGVDQRTQLMGSNVLAATPTSQEYIVFGRKGPPRQAGGLRHTDSTVSINGPQLQYSGPRKPQKGSLHRRELKTSAQENHRTQNAPLVDRSIVASLAQSQSHGQLSEFEPRQFNSSATRLLNASSRQQSVSQSELSASLGMGSAMLRDSRTNVTPFSAARATSASTSKRRAKLNMETVSSPMRFTSQVDLAHGKELERGGWMGSSSAQAAMLEGSQDTHSSAHRAACPRPFQTIVQQGQASSVWDSSSAPTLGYDVFEQSQQRTQQAHPDRHQDPHTSTFAPLETEYHTSSGYLVARGATAPERDTSSMPTFGKPSATYRPSKMERLARAAGRAPRKQRQHLESSVGLIMGSDYRMQGPVVRVPEDIKNRIDADRGKDPTLRASGTHRVTEFGAGDFKPQKRTAARIIQLQSPFIQEGIAAGRPSSASRKHTSMLEADAFWMRSDPVRYETMG